MKTFANGSDKPDAEQFARVVLWRLCGIDATLQLMEAKAIRERGQQLNVSESEILSESAANGEQIDRLARLLYRDALVQANIKPSATFPNPKK